MSHVGAPLRREATPLYFVAESETFDPAATTTELAAPPPQFGRVLTVEPRRDIYGAPLQDWLAGRATGPASSSWMYGQYIQEGPTEVCRVGPVWWYPRYGALIDPEGRVPIAPMGEAFHRWPRLDPFPGVRRDGRVPAFTPLRNALRLPASTVALPWGVSNYGHFLLDGLAAVLAVEETGLLDRFPLVTPPLRRWQAALMAMAFPNVAVREIGEPVVQLDGAVFSTAMDHYLHIPGPLMLRLRERVRAQGPAATRRDRRLYVSRRSHHMRIMLDESALEAALAQRGFDIIRPERLSVADQIRLFKEAQIVVGASGAGLANTLVCDEGVQVVEIQPQNFASFWTPSLCRLIGLDWRGYVCTSPAPREAAPWFNRVRRGFRFAYTLDVEAFLAFLDARL